MTVLRSSNLSLKLQEYRALSSCHALLADRRNKTLEWRLATLKASSAIMSHALEQTKDARIGVICKRRIFCDNVTALEQINAARIGVIRQSASSKLSASCLHGYSVSIQKIQVFFWKAIFATPPIVLAVTIHTLPWKMRVETCPFSF